MKKIIILLLSFFVIFFIVDCSIAGTEGSLKIINPLSTDDPAVLIGEVIDTIFGVVGSLALLMFIYGGLTWMTSSGNPEMIKKGKSVIVWAVIGLVVIFTSYALVRFVIIGVGA